MLYFPSSSVISVGTHTTNTDTAINFTFTFLRKQSIIMGTSAMRLPSDMASTSGRSSGYNL